MKIRPATPADVDAIVRMSAAFYSTTDYMAVSGMCPNTVADLASGLIASGVMLIAESDDREVLGMVGLAVVPGLFNRNVLGAHEVVWYVVPDARAAGVGRALLAAVPDACRARGAKACWMMALATSSPHVGEAYAAAGWQHSETNYMMVL